MRARTTLPRASGPRRSRRPRRSPGASSSRPISRGRRRGCGVRRTRGSTRGLVVAEGRLAGPAAQAEGALAPRVPCECRRVVDRAAEISKLPSAKGGSGESAEGVRGRSPRPSACLSKIVERRRGVSLPPRQKPRLYQVSACAGNTLIVAVYSDTAGKSFAASTHMPGQSERGLPLGRVLFELPSVGVDARSDGRRWRDGTAPGIGRRVESNAACSRRPPPRRAGCGTRPGDMLPSRGPGSPSGTRRLVSLSCACLRQNLAPLEMNRCPGAILGQGERRGEVGQRLLKIAGGSIGGGSFRTQRPCYFSHSSSSPWCAPPRPHFSPVARARAATARRRHRGLR